VHRRLSRDARAGAETPVTLRRVQPAGGSAFGERNPRQ